MMREDEGIDGKKTSDITYFMKHSISMRIPYIKYNIPFF